MHTIFWKWRRGHATPIRPTTGWVSSPTPSGYRFIGHLVTAIPLCSQRDTHWPLNYSPFIYPEFWTAPHVGFVRILIFFISWQGSCTSGARLPFGPLKENPPSMHTAGRERTKMVALTNSMDELRPPTRESTLWLLVCYMIGGFLMGMMLSDKLSH